MWDPTYQSAEVPARISEEMSLTCPDPFLVADFGD